MIQYYHNGFFHNLEDGLKVFQPELTYFPYTKNGKIYPNDYHVWGRLVKTDLYQVAINNLGISALGEKRGLQFLNWNEDTAATVALFRYLNHTNLFIDLVFFIIYK